MTALALSGPLCSVQPSPGPFFRLSRSSSLHWVRKLGSSAQGAHSVARRRQVPRVFPWERLRLRLGSAGTSGRAGKREQSVALERQERACSLSSYTTLVGHPALPGTPFLHCQVKDLEALGISGLQAFAVLPCGPFPHPCAGLFALRGQSPAPVQFGMSPALLTL